MNNLVRHQESIKNAFKISEIEAVEFINNLYEQYLNEGIKINLDNNCSQSFEHPLYNKYIKETGKDFADNHGYTSEFVEWLMDIITKGGAIT
jgi:hypothetical protein